MASPDSSPGPHPNGTPLLLVEHLDAGYGRRQVVFGADLQVREGEVVAVLGHNGAGKTTTLKAIFGFVKPSGGRIVFAGTDVTTAGPAKAVGLGMTFTPAEHFVFGGLSVRDNLRLGGLVDTSGRSEQARLEAVFEVFPRLKERLGQLAGTMSGGEQRMVSLGIGLMATPRLMLLDEPSLGLSPVLVSEIMDVIKAAAAKNRTAVVLLEQNVSQALRVADRAYVMRGGRIILEETAEQMLARESWWDLF